jgi:DNA mismatch repair ATPase MutL
MGAVGSEAAQRDASASSASSTPQRRRGSSIPASERIRREFVPDVAKDDSSLASLDSESDLSGFLVDGSQTDEELPESEAAATPRHAPSVDPDGVADAMPPAQSGQHGGAENVKLPATADRTDGAQLANVDDDGSIAGAGNSNENDEDDTLPAAQAEVYPGLGDTPLRMSELGGTPLGGGDSGGDAGRSASALLPSRQGPIGNSDGAVARTLSFTTQPGASAVAVDEGDDERGAEEEAIDDFSSPLKSRARCPEWRDVGVPQSVDDWRELPALATAQLPALLASAPATSSKKKVKRGRKQEWAALGSAECEADLRRSFTRADFERMRVLGQFNDGFIAARVGDDFFILDQHASDEKHTYERLKESYVARAQPLLAPIPVVADEDEVEAAYNHADELAAHGFRLAPLPPDSDAAAGPREIRVSAIPVLQYEKVEAADVLQLTRQLKDHGTITTPIRAVWHSLATKACRTSVMIGKPLALPAMERIVRNMVGMDHPWNCPHGRPTMRHVGRAEAGDEASHDSFMATVPDVTSFLKRHRAEAEAEEHALDEEEE